MEPYLRPEGTQLRQGHAEVPAVASHEANPLALLLAIAADPRNSWMGGPGKIVHGAESLPALIAGLGPLFKSGRGWEVLKEYIRKGGTPQSLRELLRTRDYNEPITTQVARDVRQGTDLAAPPAGLGTRDPEAIRQMNERTEQLRQRYPEHVVDWRGMVPGEQQQALEGAARLLFHDRPGKGSFKTAGELSQLRAKMEAADPGYLTSNPSYIKEVGKPLESGTQGQAAYQAIASRMARLMDDPNFLSIREHYLPPPVSDAVYYRELPIQGQNTADALWGHGPGGLYAAQDARTAALNQRIEEIQRERAGMAPPRSFAAAENQRTSNLNRRADQRQNPPEEP